jgi:hypothetical protein
VTADVTIRRIPGFVWVRLVVLPLSWRRGSWWAVRGIVRTHALGPLRLVTMRTDCVERAHASGVLPA